ncbi:MAG: hypothetical protein AB1546_13910 [bacterium]
MHKIIGFVLFLIFLFIFDNLTSAASHTKHILPAGEAMVFMLADVKNETSHLWLQAESKPPVKIVSSKDIIGTFVYSAHARSLIYQKKADETREGYVLFTLVQAPLPEGDEKGLVVPPKDNSDLNPVVSPGGAYLAFNRVNFRMLGMPEYDAGVFIVELKEKAEIRKVDIPQIEGYIHIPLCFSPKGRHIAIQRVPLAGRTTGDSLIIETSTGKILRMLKGARVEEWSPDGKTLLLTALQNGETGMGIFTAPAGKSTRTSLTVEGFSDENPRWAPDGKHIICHSRTPEGASMGIWKISVATGDRVLLTEDGTSAEWSPDGEVIYFARRPSAKRQKPEIWRMSQDGHDERKVADGEGNFIIFAWHKDEADNGR